MRKKTTAPSAYQEYLDKLSRDRAGVVCEIGVRIRRLGATLDEMVTDGLPKLQSMSRDMEFISVATELYQAIENADATLEAIQEKIRLR